MDSPRTHRQRLRTWFRSRKGDKTEQPEISQDQGCGNIDEEETYSLYENPWGKAYECLLKQNPTLVTQYGEDLAAYAKKKDPSNAGGFDTTTFNLGLAMTQKDQMIEIAKDICKDASHPEWKRFSENFDKAVKIVGMVKDFVSSAVSAEPHAALAWAGVSVFIPLLLNPSQQRSEMVDGLDTIATIIRRYAVVYERFKSKYAPMPRSTTTKVTPLLDSFQKKLVELYVSILEFQAKTVHANTDHLLIRISKDMIKFNSWGDHVNGIRSLEGECNEISNDIDKDLIPKILEEHQKADQDWKNNIEQIMEKNLVAMRKELQSDSIMKWLDKTDPSTNNSQAVNERTENTGLRLLDSKEFQSWRNGDLKIFWVHGISGCGKTVLCSTIIEAVTKRIHQETTPLTYFYFDIRDGQKQSVDSMFMWMLRQICFQIASVPDEVIDLYNSRGPGKSLPSKKLQETLLKVIAGLEKVYIIMDALDECSAVEKVLQFIREVNTHCSGQIRLLFTSQRQRSIEDGLSTMKGRNFHEFEISKDTAKNDIQIYIKDKFTSSAKLKKWSSSRPKIEKQLINSAEGSFRLVSCQLSIIEQCNSERDLNNAMNDLPSDLDTVYSRILARISKNDKPKVLAILHWLGFSGSSSRQLTPQELIEAAAIDPKEVFSADRRIHNPPDLLDICSTFITVTRDSLVSDCWGITSIQLAHPSVLRYLESRNLLGGHDTQFTGLRAREFFAESCLQYLLSLDRKNNIFLAIEDKTNPFPLLKYAAEYWMAHAKYAPETNNHTLPEPTGKLAEQFLDLKGTNGSWIAYGLLWWDQHRVIPWNSWTKVSLSDNGLKTYVYEVMNSHDIYHRDIQRDQNALPIIADLGHTALLQLALEAGTDPNVVGTYHNTALQAASFRGYTETAKLLLDYGADVNIQGGGYGTALNAASLAHKMKTIQLLLDHGADINTEGEEYETSLIATLYVKEYGDDNYGDYMSPDDYREQKAIVQLLLDHGADAIINSKAGEKRKSALQYARIQHREAIGYVDYLIHDLEDELALEETDEETDEDTDEDTGDDKEVVNLLKVGIKDCKESVKICEEIINLLLAHGAKDKKRGRHLC